MRRMVRTIFGIVSVLMFVETATAGGIKVLCANGLKGVMQELGPKFESTTGQQLAISFGTLGVVVERIESGERADLVLIPTQGIDRLVKGGKGDATSVVVLARSGIGLIVRKGAPKPDIATPEEFRKTLVSAASITYLDPATGGTSGVHFVKVLDRLGITATVKPKSILHANAREAGALVAGGGAEIGVNLIQELMPLPGVELVGPLPGDLQNTLVFAAAILTAAEDRVAANKFIAFMRTSDAMSTIAAHGLEPADQH
jgi:molybdate transport system substrate-binding protein